MKRNQRWWKGLTKKERRELFYLQYGKYKYYESLGEVGGVCGCGMGTTLYPLCVSCIRRISELESKADTRAFPLDGRRLVR